MEDELQHIAKPLDLVMRLERFKLYKDFETFYDHLYFTEKQNMVVNLNRSYLKYGLTHEEVLTYMFFHERHILFATIDDYFKSYILSDYKNLADAFKSWRPTINI